MPDLVDGQTVHVWGSAAQPYVLKNVGGVYSCSCPAWRNQSLPIDRRSCKHLRQYFGEQAEAERVGGTVPAAAKAAVAKPAAHALLLAHAWDNEQDLTGWHMSEKLDGVRAYWDGSRFWSRQGNLFHAPEWFVQGLPQMPLDGELWIGRKKFQQTVGIVRRQDGGDLWKYVQFAVFDAPAASGPFEERMRVLRDCGLELKASQARILEQTVCHGTDSLRAELERIESLGGEGLMLRQPASLYEAGRSHTLLKVKRFHDAEARVVGHLSGTGRHRGRLGAVEAELPSGVRFAVGTGFTDAQREQPPPIGTTITFRYQELTDGGVPRFPSFVRVRTEQPSRSPQFNFGEGADA